MIIERFFLYGFILWGSIPQASHLALCGQLDIIVEKVATLYGRANVPKNMSGRCLTLKTKQSNMVA